jgi:D-alanyl-D-alanine carboxypeptidase
MVNTTFRSPHGLPPSNRKLSEGDLTSPRDFALLSRYLIEKTDVLKYTSVKTRPFGAPVRTEVVEMKNHDNLLGQVPGVDGLKTGFTNGAGFCLSATAQRNGRRIIVVVMGSPAVQTRDLKVTELLERGFAANPLSWLKPASGTVDSLAPIDATPPNLRDEMCGGKRKRPASDEDDDASAISASAGGPGGENAVTFFTAGLQPPMAKPSELLATGPAANEPMVVYTGPKKTGPALIT